MSSGRTTNSARLQDCIARELRARMELDEYYRGQTHLDDARAEAIVCYDCEQNLMLTLRNEIGLDT